MENVNSKKKTIILTIIGLITLISLVVGATFAFYTMTTNDKTNPTNVSGNTEGLGQAILTNPTPKLHLKLSAVDMNSANKGKVYYATNDINKNYDTEETKRSIAIASVGGGLEDTKNQCESTLTIEIDGSMKDVLTNGDGKIVLTPTSGIEIETTEIDLKDLADKTSITLPVVYKITGSNEEKIEAIMLINNRETDQINLAGKQININITNSSFKCEVVSEFIDPMTPDDIINNPTPGVVESTGIVEDELAVRYYGTNPYNYICFGTSDKDTCVNDTDKYMYRIIGITKDNKMKLIKKEALNTAYHWHNSYSSDIKWPESDLYKGLNGISGGTYNNLFIGNEEYLPTTWLNKIDNHNWKYGDIYNSTTHDATNITAAEMVQKEQGFTTTVSAKIGLMYLADYCFGLSKTGTNCSFNSSGTYPTCKTSWMHLIQNDTKVSENRANEWTMSRYGRDNSNYRAWNIYSGGSINLPNLDYEISIRPVFYLTSNTKITSGTGTINDPYIIK